MKKWWKFFSQSFAFGLIFHANFVQYCREGFMRFGHLRNALCNHSNRSDQEFLPHNSQGKFSEELHANILFLNILENLFLLILWRFVSGNIPRKRSQNIYCSHFKYLIYSHIYWIIQRKNLIFFNYLTRGPPGGPLGHPWGPPRREVEIWKAR